MSFIGKNGLILYIKYYIINFIVYTIFYFFVIFIHNFVGKKIIKIQKNKGTRNLYAPLIFYDFVIIQQ